MPSQGIEDYITKVIFSVQGQEAEIKLATDWIHEATEKKLRVWVLGNGGSLAIAQHFAQDLLKMQDVRAQCLNDPSVITAFTNDEGFENCHSMPLEKLVSHDDVVVMFSCSGKSRNYLNLFHPEKIFKTIAIVGTDGGFMKEKADLCVHIKDNNYQICEAAFGIVADMINIWLGEKNA